MGKQISHPQHIQLSYEMMTKILKNFGWGEDLAKIAGLLISNHSFESRLESGENSYGYLNDMVQTLSDENNKKPFIQIMSILNAGDIRGVGREGRLNPYKLENICKLGHLTPEDIAARANNKHMYYLSKSFDSRPSKDGDAKILSRMKEALLAYPSVDRIADVKKFLGEAGISYIEFLTFIME